MTYQETLDYMIAQLPMFHRQGKSAYKANLDNTIKLDEYFGHQHLKYKTIHVAGTNGKGSVSHYLASILQASGYKTGLYTSPHLRDFRERIKINGEMIEEQEVTDFIEKHKTIFEEIKPSFFEMTVALAFNHFARQEVDFAVIEVGLGGRLDSTNIISPILSIITNISYDHVDLLGDTLEKIAFEKAGIIKPNIPVVVGESQVESKPVFISKAKENNSPIFFADENYSCKGVFQLNETTQVISIQKDNTKFDIFTDLKGDYQQKNVCTVMQAIDLLRDSNISIPFPAVLDGFGWAAKNTGLMGRWQILNQKPLVICDTGHNEAGIQYVVNQINNTPHKALHFVFGAVNDKDIDRVLLLLPKKAIYYFTKANIPRALNEKILMQKVAEFNLSGNCYPTVNEAYTAALYEADEDDLIFIGGSTFVVAEVV